MTELSGPAADAATSPDETVHMCPPGQADKTPCCGRSVMEMALADVRERITNDPALVTCRPATSPDEAEREHPSPSAVERALKLQEGSVLAREVLRLRAELTGALAVRDRALMEHARQYAELERLRTQASCPGPHLAPGNEEDEENGR